MLSHEKDLQKEKDIDLSISDLGEQLDLLLRETKNLNIPVLIIVEGWESSGKGYVINRLRRELDPRYYHVQLFMEEEPADQKYPLLRRIWEEIPKKGYLSIFDHSYYARIFDHFQDDETACRGELSQWLVQENLLSHDKTIIVKLFLDITEDTQKESIEDLQKDEYADFLVSKRDLKQNENYNAYRAHMDDVLTLSHTKDSPWTVISMEDRKAGAKRAMETVIRHIEERLEAIRADSLDLPPVSDISRHRIDKERIPRLDTLDMSSVLPKEEYDEVLEDLQKEARDLAYEMYTKSKSMMIAFEGTDAAGKGGAIKRLTKYIDPRSYRIHTTAAPTEEERAYHYMHRFITKLPSRRQIKIFDRSWYGRVMVERIEGFATEAEWMRAYDEINALEAEWTRKGIRVVKFYLAIDKDEQQKRFEAREEDPTKQYKLTDEDWRNREKWDQYQTAVQDMFDKTTTKDAPWILISGNDKNYARVEVLKHVIREMKDVLGK